MRETKSPIKADKKIASLDKYSGQWVAFLDDKVIDSGTSLNGLMKKVEKKGLEKKVSVFLVPKKRENLIVQLYGQSISLPRGIAYDRCEVDRSQKKSESEGAD